MPPTMATAMIQWLVPSSAPQATVVVVVLVAGGGGRRRRERPRRGQPRGQEQPSTDGGRGKWLARDADGRLLLNGTGRRVEAVEDAVGSIVQTSPAATMGGPPRPRSATGGAGAAGKLRPARQLGR